MKKQPQEAVTTTETDTHTESAPEKGPLWSDESESKRVRATIWGHKNGNRVRYSVGISRSYYDKEENRWVNTSYFDQKDLDDVSNFAQLAKKKLARIIDGEQV